MTLARIDIPRQDIAGEENLAAPGGTSITPWRTREDHRPIGEIERVREDVYRRSSIERQRINQQPRVEPESSAQLLGRAVGRRPLDSACHRVQPVPGCGPLQGVSW